MNFNQWINQAYREPEVTNFTIANMEVAYEAGYSEAQELIESYKDYISLCEGHADYMDRKLVELLEYNRELEKRLNDTTN